MLETRRSSEITETHTAHTLTTSLLWSAKDWYPLLVQPFHPPYSGLYKGKASPNREWTLKCQDCGTDCKSACWETFL